jgi:hypothetical protein
MTIEQISIFVENQPGRLAEITKILAEAQVDLRAMCIADTADFGILRVIVDSPSRAIQALEASNCVVSITQVLAVEIEDTPGSLARVLAILAKEDVSVEYLYAFITRKKDDAYVIFRVEDPERATEIFASHDIRTAAAKDLYDL